VQRAEFSARELAHALVGRELAPITREPAAPAAATEQPALSLRELRVMRDGVERIAGVSLDLAPGRILGIAGVEGNGQTELCLALAGLLPCAGGRVVLHGRDITADTIAERRDAGMAWVLEDRQRHGLVLDFSLAENLLLGRQARYRQERLLGLPLGGLVRWLIAAARLGQDAGELLQRHDVRPAEHTALARSLSGGNQQKLLLARALADDEGGAASSRVLVVAQPTRGVDIGAVQAIHQLLLSARDRGCAILLVSSELDELRTLCDRIAVLYRGRVVAELDNPASAPVERERLGELLAGLGSQVAAGSAQA
jgi:simple sugar transport system ATP-binding protein